MPEPGLPRLDATRRERLAALGIELLALRSELSTAAGVEATPEPGKAPATHRATRLSVGGIDWPSGEPLPRAVIAALGLRPEEVSAEPAAGRPALVFGAGAADAAAAIVAPTLAELRDAGRKRALWPALRRLRRQLAGEPRA